MPIDYSALTPGQAISYRSYRLDDEAVAAYLEAVGDRTSYEDDDGRMLAPPMAVAALSLRGVVNDLEIPVGTLHAGQELEFHAAVRTGETLACNATLLQNSVRGERRFVVVQLAVTDSSGRKVMAGKSTLLVPP